jgi:hypothetical protein
MSPSERLAGTCSPSRQWGKILIFLGPNPHLGFYLESKTTAFEINNVEIIELEVIGLISKEENV